MTLTVKHLCNQTKRWLDPHLLLVWLLTLPAAMPLIQPTITHSADGLLHLYRLVALNQALQQSETFFFRWLPDLAYGYGFPLFIFYAPLSYYITLALNLFGLGTITAFNASFSLALFLAGSGVYLFVKDLFGPKAGVLAGAAYVYAPFQLLNTLSRGGLPAAWAMALFPFVFWAFGRLIRPNVSEGSRTVPTPSAATSNENPGVQSLLCDMIWQSKLCTPDILYFQGSTGCNRRFCFRRIIKKVPALLPISALILGAALLTHNTLSLLFAPLLGLYLGLELLMLYLWRPAGSAPGPLPGRGVMRVGLAVILGLGLAAFFLLPAIIEKEFAQVHRVITSPDFDFHFNFVTLTELFSLPQAANTGLLNPEFPLTLGLAQVGLAAMGLAGLLSYYLKQRRFFTPWLTITIFVAIALTGAIFMMLPISVGVWERLPLLAFVQFPHRWLGPTAFVLAILAGAAVATLPERFGFGLTLVGIILIFVTTVPLLYPRYYDQLPTEPSLLDMMAYEHTSGAIGTTSFGEYLPVWVKQVPRESPLEAMYQTGATIKRLDPAYLPRQAQVEAASYGFNRVDLVINSPEPYQAVFHTFYFPGWEALVDGQPGPIAPVSERGLIGVSLPAGRHHLALYFRETPLRRAANMISILAGVSLLIMLGANLGRILYSVKADNAPYAIRNRLGGFNCSQLLALTGLALLLVVAKALYLDRYDNPLKQRFDGAVVAKAGVSKQVNFGGQVNLLGYDLERSTVAPGDVFDLTVYWQARQLLSSNYSALAQLVDAEHHLYAGQDNLHPGTLKTTLWQPWGFAKDRHPISVPPGTPPGEYFLVTGLYDPTTWVRLPVIAGGDSGWSDVIPIPVTVTRPARPPTIDELGISWPVEAEFGPDLRLLGATPEREAIPRKDFLRIALFWEAKAAPTIDYRINLRLLTPDGAVALQETTRPSHNRYPTTLWAPGERVRDNHALWIPPDFPTEAGPFLLQVQVLDAAGLPVGPWVELGTMGRVE